MCFDSVCLQAWQRACMANLHLLELRNTCQLQPDSEGAFPVNLFLLIIARQKILRTAKLFPLRQFGVDVYTSVLEPALNLSNTKARPSANITPHVVC